MSGLEKIIEHITLQANENASLVIDNAQEEANKVIKTAEKEANKKEEEILQNSELECNDIIARGKSACQLYKKREMLEAKQLIISDMLVKAKNSLISLESDKYFEILNSMIKKHSTKEKGLISFNQKDNKRVSKEFLKDLEKNYNLTLSESDANIEAGFILIYGDIEINCSILSLFESEMEQLQDTVNKLLFTK